MSDRRFRGLNPLNLLEYPACSFPPEPPRHADAAHPAAAVTILLNGDPYDVDGELSITHLLARLAIDPRRVAVEHNLVVIKRAAYDTTMVHAGDQVEIVNFVGGGAGAAGDLVLS